MYECLILTPLAASNLSGSSLGFDDGVVCEQCRNKAHDTEAAVECRKAADVEEREK